MSDDLKRTAFHEGGHTAAAIALGIEVTEVTIGRGGGFAGLTQVNLRDPISTAIVNLAGPAASQRLFAGDSQYGMEGDHSRANGAIDEATGDYASFADVSAYACRRASISVQVRSAAALIIEHHWPEVVAIADALLERRTVDGEAAARLFERSLLTRGGRQWVPEISQC